LGQQNIAQVVIYLGAAIFCALAMIVFTVQYVKELERRKK